MGSGASKNNAKEKASFDDQDDEEDYDTFSKRVKNSNTAGAPRLEQNGLLPKLNNSSSPSKKSNKQRTSIIGLEEDEEEELEDQVLPLKNRRSKKEEERELRNEIIELEKTFENLELEDDVKKNGRISHFNRPTNHRGLYRSSTLDESRYTNGAFDNARQGRTASNRQFFGTPAIAKPLKFSWEDTKPAPIVDKSNEDWNYQQTVIDGFDPDKFRKVNKDSKKDDYDAGIRVERQFGSASSNESLPNQHQSRRRSSSHFDAYEMPGVPSYDNSEKQLLASLEQELGVL